MDYLGKNIYTKLGDVIDLTKNTYKIREKDSKLTIKYSKSIQQIDLNSQGNFL